MKQSFLGNKSASVDENAADDPFTRKSGKMRVVSGTSKSKQIIQTIGKILILNKLLAPSV